MKIRTRLAIWYSAALLIAVLVLAGGMYYELVVERHAAKVEGRIKEPMADEIREIIFIYCLPAIVIAIGGGWYLARKALAPLDALADAAERVQLQNLRQILPKSNRGDEVDRLSDVLNAMNARLDKAFVQTREFSLHASHELKTPLAVLQGELETLIHDPAAAPVGPKAMESLLTEIQRLIKIVSGLSFLAKTDAGLENISQENVPLEQLVQDAVDDAKILAVQSKIGIELLTCEPVTIQGDRNRLRQLLINLTDNAIKYNRPQGTVTFSLVRQPASALLSIRNTGAGIAPDQIGRVFDRFYRGDPAHSNEVEGCGLGLAIGQWIVHAHGGQIKIASEPGLWTTIEVSLPLPVMG